MAFPQFLRKSTMEKLIRSVSFKILQSKWTWRCKAFTWKTPRNPEPKLSGLSCGQIQERKTRNNQHQHLWVQFHSDRVSWFFHCSVIFEQCSSRMCSCTKVALSKADYFCRFLHHVEENCDQTYCKIMASQFSSSVILKYHSGIRNTFTFLWEMLTW